MERQSRIEASLPDWEWLTGEIRSAAEAFADQLRLLSSDGAASGANALVPNLDWDVRELAAHLVSLPDFYQSLNKNTEPMERPDDFVEFSRSTRAHLEQHTLDQLIEMLDSETESLLAALGDDGDAPWMLYIPTTVFKVGAGYLGELLMHGQDLAALTGATVTVQPDHANAWISASMTLAPYFVDREAARRCGGVYHLKFRGGNEYTMRVDDGLLTTEVGRPERADGHMSADPVTYMLVSMGRFGELKAGLTGKIMVYGRKPWKFARLGGIVVEGV